MDECVEYAVLGARETVALRYFPVGGVHTTVTRFLDVTWGNALASSAAAAAAGGAAAVVRPPDFDVCPDLVGPANGDAATASWDAAGGGAFGDDEERRAASVIAGVSSAVRSGLPPPRAPAVGLGVSAAPPVLPLLGQPGGRPISDPRSLTSQLSSQLLAL